MKAVSFFCVLCFSFLANAQGFDHYFNYTIADSNNIKGWMNNYGTLLDYWGFRWNLIGGEFNEIVYDQGIWVTGRIADDTILAINQWKTTYSPGPILNGQAAMLIHPEDSLRYRIYKINKGDDNSNPDYAGWPADFGAPVNQDNSPKFYGDQTHWCVYNAQDSTMSGRRKAYKWDSIPAVPIEVQQLVFLRKGQKSDYEDIFSNTVFIEYTIINKGESNIDSAFIGFWSDIDFLYALDNLPAVDSSNQLGYCWSYHNYNPGINAAVGYTLLYGPVEPSPGGTAIFKGREVDNYRNLPLYSFHGIGDDSIFDSLAAMVSSPRDAWNYARGLSSNGNPIVNPATGQVTKFPYSGDPVSSTGWFFPASSVGGGAGFVYFTGPVTMASNDTQWVMLALIPASGRTNLESVSLLRKKAQMLHSLPYDSLAFGSTASFITGIQEDNDFIPESFSLSNNYPNPFNPVTSFDYTISKKCFVHFRIFDVLGNEVDMLISGEQTAGKYQLKWDASSQPSGVYFYQIRAGEYSMTKKMILMK